MKEIIVQVSDEILEIGDECITELSKVELIRCKDCKYNVLADRPYFENTVSVETYVHCYYLAARTKEMGYCALAERKER